MDIYGPLPYVYKVTNIEDGRFYIGCRKENVGRNRYASDDLLKFYFTSGKLKDDIKKFPEKYKYEILMEFGDFDVIFWYEQILIRENIKNPLNMNYRVIDPDNGTQKLCGSKETAVPRIWTDAEKLEKSNLYSGIPKSKEFVDNITAYMASPESEEHRAKMLAGLRKRAASGIPWGHRDKPWSQARRDAHNRRKNNESGN
jgi:hypothetical protein